MIVVVIVVVMMVMMCGFGNGSNLFNHHESLHIANINLKDKKIYDRITFKFCTRLSPVNQYHLK